MIYRGRGHLTSYLFLLPYGLSFVGFIVVPFVVAAVLAFMEFDLTSQQSARFIGLGNFREALYDPYFWRAVLATMSFVVMIIPTQLGLALLLALGMNAMTRGRHAVRAALFFPGIFNVAVAGILWQWFYNREFGLAAFFLAQFGFEPIPFLSNRYLAMPSIVLMTLWWGVGGPAVVLLSGLQQIPQQIFEAAAIDGASPWQTFRQITLPLLKPVLLFMVVMNTIGAFQVFGQPFLLTRGGPEMATRGVVQLIYETAFNTYRLGYGAALSWLLFLMIAVFSLVQYRILRRAGE
jgi:multiple sugar transport system permease protein